MRGASFSVAVLKLPGNLHVTIAFKSNASQDETKQMRHDLQRMIMPLLPFKLEFGNFKHFGENNNIPAYKMKITDATVEQMVKAFHRLHYREKSGKRLYPSLKLHVTTDSAESLSMVENIIRQGNGYVMVHEASVNGGESNAVAFQHYEMPPASAPMHHQVMPAAAAEQPRSFPNGDWWCPNCQFKIFGSKNRCGKCKAQRPV